MERRGLWAGFAVVSVLALVLFAVARRGHDDAHEANAVEGLQLPNRPPALTGTAYGTILTMPCSRACVLGAGTMPVASPSSLELVAENLEVADIAPAPDGDALLLAGSRVVDARTQASAYATAGAVAMDTFPDGRLIVLVRDNDDRGHVEVVDPTTNVERRYDLDGSVYSVAAGSGGRVAVLGCCAGERNTITVIEPSGTRHHIAVDQSPRDWAPVPGMMGHAKLTWGESGLFAISSSYPFVTNDDRHAPFGAWTMVVDDRGQRVGTFGGWQGLAWSPDGLGLLGGHKVSNQDNDQRYVLEVRYGPGLRHRRRVGIAPLPIDVSAWR